MAMGKGNAQYGENHGTNAESEFIFSKPRGRIRVEGPGHTFTVNNTRKVNEVDMNVSPLPDSENGRKF